MSRSKLVQVYLMLALACWLSLTPPPVDGHTGAAGEASDWEPTGLTEAISSLFTPASGAFFARTESGLLRSDDGGSTWTTVSLPAVEPDPRAWMVTVDPTDHTVLYASGIGGLYKTTDDATSWTLVLPTKSYVRGIAVSPANHDVVYVGLVARFDISSDFWFLRTRDGGTTWEQLDEQHNMTCGWAIPILLPHPTDEQRLFRTANCYAGRDFGDYLSHSSDQGASWSPVFGEPTIREPGNPRLAFPTQLVGGHGAQPARFYLTTRRDARVGGGSSLFRSDDDGATWVELLTCRPATEPGVPSPIVRGVTYDPQHPDRVYLGLDVGVKHSLDGGSTWQDLGRQDLGTIGAVVLGIDGQSLYATTNQGLWRLRLR